LIKSEKQRQALEARTRTLDRNLKMEKELCQSLIVENIRIKQELDSRPTIKMPQSEGSRRGRKRSIDFRNESRDEPTLLRKVRRSSSVPSSNQVSDSIFKLIFIILGDYSNSEFQRFYVSFFST
jgi:hypothetical protein